jgi:hypothetical protein
VGCNEWRVVNAGKIIQMINTISGTNTLLWRQFGAAIEMLGNAIGACPDELWAEEPKFCRMSHHIVFFLHYYLSDEMPMESEYVPPPPFTKSEFEDEPQQVVYAKAEILEFLRLGREKLREQLRQNGPDQLLAKRFISEYKDFSLFELLLYNMRHVQHHAAQLNLLLRQRGIVPPDWVSITEEEL